MSKSFTLVDAQALADLRVYLSRAGRVENGSVRLIAGSGVLAVYTAILYPHGLLDPSATVLGLRTWAVTDDTAFDVVVPVMSLLNRLEQAEKDLGDAAAPGDRGSAPADVAEPIRVRVPHEVSTVTWTGISPPRGGWAPIDPIDAPVLESAARAGIEEVATVIPEGTGEQIVQRVRSEVWAKPVPGVEHLPAGAAFAAYSLGFLKATDRVTAFQTGPWTRLTTSRGHVLVRHKPWTLKP